MDLKDFSKDHRLRNLRKDECGNWNIVGQRGEIYKYSQHFFAAAILRAPGASHWNKYQAVAQAAGCQIIQNGDTEGTFLFDPHNTAQAQIAITATRLKVKRQLSDETRSRLRERLSRMAEFRARNDDDSIVKP